MGFSGLLVQDRQPFFIFFFKSSMYLACILYASYLLDFTDFEQPGIFENR